MDKTQKESKSSTSPPPSGQSSLEKNQYGPCGATATGKECKYQYILVIMDYNMQYPEAIPFHLTTAATITTELMKVFA